MWNTLRDLIFPHAGNDHRPRVLDPAPTVALLAVLILLLAASVLGTVFVARTGIIATIYPSVLVDLANENRQERGVTPLTHNDQLARAAELKAAHMDELGYFSHHSPDGISPWHWMQEAGYEFVYAGENLAVDFSNTNPVNQAWMNSPTHRENILAGQFREIGIAVREGTLDGEETTFVVQMFGTPAAIDQLAQAPRPGEESGPSAVELEAEADEELDQQTETGGVQGVSTPEEDKTDTSKTDPEQEPKPKVEAAGTSSSANESDGIEVVHEDGEFIAARNTDVEPPPATTESTQQDRSFVSPFERILLNPAEAFSFIFGLIAIGLIAVIGASITIEVRKKHPQHIIHGVLLLVITVSFLTVNHSIASMVASRLFS